MSKKISELEAAVELTGEEMIEAVQDGASVAATLAQVKDYVGGAGVLRIICNENEDHDALVLTIVENTTNAAISVDAFSPGDYRINSNIPLFTDGRTFITANPFFDNDPSTGEILYARVTYEGDQSIRVQSLRLNAADEVISLEGGIIYNMGIEIRIYP